MTKSKLFILSMCLFAALCLQAQEKMPQAISYQAVARDAQGKVIAAQTIGVKVEILKGSASGEVVFSETHNPTSSRTGTVNLLIGQGSPVTGEFAAIDWGGDTYYLQLSMDVAGGSNYQLVSTTQMLPVPYALYAAKAGSAETVENGGNSGGEESSSDMPKFVIVPDDDKQHAGFFHRLFTEGGRVKHNFRDYYLGIEFHFVYLDGINHELDYSVEGLPETVSVSRDDTPSSFMGKYCYMNIFDIPRGETNVKFVIKNKAGEVIQEYPFILECE